MTDPAQGNPDDEQIRLEDGDAKGRLVYQEQGAPEAELTFSRAGERLIIIDHTGVPDHYRGRGIGEKLVRAMVDHARLHERKIIPLCPFAASIFRRHAELGDVLRD